MKINFQKTELDRLFISLQEMTRHAEFETQQSEWGDGFSISPKEKAAAGVKVHLEKGNDWLDVTIGNCSFEWNLYGSLAPQRFDLLNKILKSTISGNYSESEWSWMNKEMQILGSTDIMDEKGAPIVFGRTNIFFFVLSPWCQVVKRKYAAY
jgi:hypothetical protein